MSRCMRPSRFLYLKLVSVALAILSLVILGLGAIPFTVITSVKGSFPNSIMLFGVRFGCWWAGIPSFILSALGFFSNTRIGLISAATLAFFTLCIVVASVVINVIGAIVLDGIGACLSIENSLSGKESYRAKASECRDKMGRSRNSCWCVGEHTCATLETEYGCDYPVNDYAVDVFQCAIVVVLLFLVVVCFCIVCYFSLQDETLQPKPKRHIDLTLQSFDETHDESHTISSPKTKAPGPEWCNHDFMREEVEQESKWGEGKYQYSSNDPYPPPYELL